MNYAEHLLMCLLAICMSSFEKFVFLGDTFKQYWSSILMVALKNYLFFIFGWVVSQLQHVGPHGVHRLLSGCGSQASVVPVHGLELHRGMWDLSSLTSIRLHFPCIERQIVNHWTTRQVPGQYFIECS